MKNAKTAKVLYIAAVVCFAAAVVELLINVPAVHAASTLCLGVIETCIAMALDKETDFSSNLPCAY